MKRKRANADTQVSASKLPRLHEEHTGSYISNLLDSSDEGENEGVDENYTAILQAGLTNDVSASKYSASYILTDISNRLLLSSAVTASYKKLKDPLQFKLNILSRQNFLYKTSLKGIESLNEKVTEYKTIVEQFRTAKLDANIWEEKLIKAEASRHDWIKNNKSKCVIRTPAAVEEQKDENFVQEVYIAYEELSKDLAQELDNILKLQQDRNELNKTLKGAFPFIPKRLTPTLIQKYKSITGNESDEFQIVKHLSEIRERFKNSQINKKEEAIDELFKVFEVESLVNKNNTEYLKLSKDALWKKIENAIGRGASEKDIQEYIRLNQKELGKDSGFLNIKDNNLQVVNYIKDKINKYIDENSLKIFNILKLSKSYITDPGYLAELEIQDFLVQIRTYRKIHRDIQKTILLSGEEGKITIPPGVNTTVDITPGGSSSLWLGEFGSYSEIAAKQLETLRHYGEYILGSTEEQAREKEENFKSLCQIEAIRNPSALLTIPMFFELSTARFQFIRPVTGTGDEKEYNFHYITKQLPMAMTGAVAGSVHLEHELGSQLTVKLPYDYREEGKEADAETLESRNKAILFDWLSQIIDAKTIQEQLNEQVSIPETLTVGSSTWEIIKNSNEAVTLSNGATGYQVIYRKGRELQKEVIAEIKTLVTGNLNKLLEIDKGVIKLKNNQLGKYYITQTANGEFYKVTEQNNKELAAFSVNIINRGTKVSFTLKELKRGTEIEEIANKYCLIEFKTISTTELENLINKWYHITLPYLQDKTLNFPLKAVACLKDADREEGSSIPLIMKNEKVSSEESGNNSSMSVTGYSKSNTDISSSIIAPDAPVLLGEEGASIGSH